MRALVIVVLLIAMAACRDDRPQAPTAAEAAQLNEADAMLNGLAKEEGPENRSPGPSNHSN